MNNDDRIVICPFSDKEQCPDGILVDLIENESENEIEIVIKDYAGNVTYRIGEITLDGFRLARGIPITLGLPTDNKQRLCVYDL